MCSLTSSSLLPVMSVYFLLTRLARSRGIEYFYKLCELMVYDLEGKKKKKKLNKGFKIPFFINASIMKQVKLLTLHLYCLFRSR